MISLGASFSDIAKDYIIPISEIVVITILGGATLWMACEQTSVARKQAAVASDQASIARKQNSISERVAKIDETESYPRISWYSVGDQDANIPFRKGIRNHGLRQVDQVIALLGDGESKPWFLKFSSVAPCSSVEYDKFKPEALHAKIDVIQFRDYNGEYWQLFPDTGPRKVEIGRDHLIAYHDPSEKNASDAKLNAGEVTACG